MERSSGVSATRDAVRRRAGREGAYPRVRPTRALHVDVAPQQRLQRLAKLAGHGALSGLLRIACESLAAVAKRDRKSPGK